MDRNGSGRVLAPHGWYLDVGCHRPVSQARLPRTTSIRHDRAWAVSKITLRAVAHGRRQIRMAGSPAIWAGRLGRECAKQLGLDQCVVSLSRTDPTAGRRCTTSARTVVTSLFMVAVVGGPGSRSANRRCLAAFGLPVTGG